MAVCSLYTSPLPLVTKQLPAKRKWEEEADPSSPGLSPVRDQTVPQLSPREKRPRTEFPFSELMRSMAARYQPAPAPAPQQYNPLLMSLLAPLNNPYSRLMAAMADMSQPRPAPAPASPPPRPQTTESTPLDLSKEKEIDVVTTDEEEEDQEESRVADWSPRRVSRFVRGLAGCEDWAAALEAEKVTGAWLAAASVPQLVQLGLPLGQALRIVSSVRRLDN